MNATTVRTSCVRNSQGAVLVQVAVALLALLALSSFVFDYGVMWVSRGQAQNAADAGALAGAISLAFDDPGDQDDARARAIAMAQRNFVWGQAPDVTDADVTFPPCPPGPGVPDTCVKVDTFRNQARGNPLPTFFSRLVGVMDQGVRATATAQVVTGSGTDCLRPWAVLDRWLEAGAEGPGPQPMSTFDRYSDGQGNNPPPEADVYTPPWEGGGTGYTLPTDYGRPFAIKMGPTGGNEISSGWFRTIDLARADTTQLGNNTVQTNILSCNGLPSNIAGPTTEPCPVDIPNNWEDTRYWATQGCYRVQTGATVGSTRNTIEQLMALDGEAEWLNGEISGSDFDPPTSSPRVVPIGVMDIDWYLRTDPTGNNGVVRMVNIYGFFIEGMGDVDRDTGLITMAPNGQSVIGRLVTMPAMQAGASTLPSNASFLRSIILVR